MGSKPKHLCVNFFGGPGAGKTVASAELFYSLKCRHIDCELVAEYPKDLVLENNAIGLANQLYVFANQQYRVECAYRNTRVAIVDSPLLLSAIYNREKVTPTFRQLVLEQHQQFNNLNIVLRRNYDFPHSMSGRIHSLTESVTIDNQIVELLNEHDIPFLEQQYGEGELDMVVDFIVGVVDDANPLVG